MTEKLSKEEIEELINSDPLTKRHFALDKLKSGEFSWREYIDSLTPEELEQERERKRYWSKQWYQNNKDKKREYAREYYSKTKTKCSQWIRKENVLKLFVNVVVLYTHVVRHKGILEHKNIKMQWKHRTNNNKIA